MCLCGNLNLNKLRYSPLLYTHTHMHVEKEENTLAVTNFNFSCFYDMEKRYTVIEI